MPFTLEVEFSGLCQYLIQRDGKQVGIVMPDGRQNGRRGDGRPIAPPDFRKFNTYLVPHVGYLRYDLADVAVLPNQTPAVSNGGGASTPSHEVIYRFDFDDLDFGPGFEPMQKPTLDMPKVEEFAPTVSTKPGLFGEKPPNELLMRTILRGGSLTTQPNGGVSTFNLALNPKGQPYVSSFAGFATWKTSINTAQLELRIRHWNGADKTVIRLRPREPDGTVRLKVGNLCAENPLEWPELFLRMANGEPDNDFKWFYSLWRDSRGDFEKVLSPPHLLPVPEPIEAHGDVTNCTGSQSTVDSVEGA